MTAGNKEGVWIEPPLSSCGGDSPFPRAAVGPAGTWGCLRSWDSLSKSHRPNSARGKGTPELAEDKVGASQVGGLGIEAFVPTGEKGGAGPSSAPPGEVLQSQD